MIQSVTVAKFQGCNIQRRQDCNPTPFQRHSTGIGRIGAFRRGVEWRCLGLADWNWNWTAIPFHVGIGMAWRGEIFEFEGLEWRGVTPEKTFKKRSGLQFCQFHPPRIAGLTLNFKITILPIPIPN